MAQKYVPKPISFAPPILKRKFIAPDNPREMGAMVMIIGFVITTVCAWPTVNDIKVSQGAMSATAKLVANAPHRLGNESRLVGAYLFQDEVNADEAVRSNRIHANGTRIPKTARVVWPKGRPQKAQVIGEYHDYLLGVPIGLGIFGFGLWLRRKREDGFDEAMNHQAPDAADPSV
jgi:hypothetical protein